MKFSAQLSLFVGVAVLTMLTKGADVYAQMQPAPKVDPARGQQIASQVCAACHGVDGNSAAPANPRLAQQHSEYLYKQLLDYTVRQGQQRPARENAIMNGMASQLSDDDKRNVSAWFASQALAARYRSKQANAGSWAADLACWPARKVIACMFRLPQPCRSGNSGAVSALGGAARRVRGSNAKRFSARHASQ